MRPKGSLVVALILTAAAVLAWLVVQRLQDLDRTPRRGAGSASPIPVEVAPVQRGPVELRRAFTGTLEAHAEFVVAPKVSGRIEQITVDLADTVRRGQRAAKLDDDEYVQAVAQAEADLAVATANLGEAESLLQIAERELRRIDKLRERGVSSESQRDAAKADELAKQAHVVVSRAQVKRAEAALETARIRLGYTEVTAGWQGGDDERVVAERYVDEGETVSANAPLLRIVELDPITAVFFVTERDYGSLHPGQTALLNTDAYPGESFPGRIVRIAPVFRETVRQARVELQVENPGLRLKPGMFVRAIVVLDRVADANTVPEQALTTRDGQRGVFVLTPDGQAVRWRPVQVGIREGERVQVIGDGLTSRVVILGQQLLGDDSAVSVARAGGEPGP
jgi:RND family efflux transporter MFP subunit